MDDIPRIVEMIETIRDRAGDVVSEIPFEHSQDAEDMRWYFLGMSDGMVSLLSYIMAGDPVIALHSNMREIWEKIKENDDR